MLRISLPIMAVFFAAALSAQAQSNEFDCARGKVLSAQEGQKLVQALDQAYRKLASFKSDFRQEAYLAALESSESSEGEVMFLRPGKMRWDYLKPEKQLFLSDGKTFWFYQPEQNQVVIDKLSDKLSGDLPISFLMGIGELGRDFKLTKACSLPTGNLLDLTPKKANPGIKNIRFVIDKYSSLPKVVEVNDKDDNRNTFYFGRLDSSVKISSNDFSPNFPAGVDRIDQREQARASVATTH